MTDEHKWCMIESIINLIGDRVVELNHKKDILYLHIGVMLFSFSGIIAQYVEVPAISAAMGRVLCSSTLLFCIAKIRRESLRLDNGKDYAAIIATGVVLAIHWVTFFYSIQISTVAIGAITFTTFPLFITFIEPVVFRERLKIKSIIRAVFVLIGVMITVPEFSLGNQMTVGIIWGMVSSFTYAIATMANRYFSKKYTSRVVCIYEQGTAAIALLPSLFIVTAVWRVQDIIGVIIVGCVCTAFAYSFYITAQKRVKAQIAGIIAGMETVYGIFFAFILLGEIPTIRELVGGAVILGVALLTSLDKKG